MPHRSAARNYAEEGDQYEFHVSVRSTQRWYRPLYVDQESVPCRDHILLGTSRRNFSVIDKYNKKITIFLK